MIRWLTAAIAIFACAASAGAQRLGDADLERIVAFVRAAGIVRYFGSPPAGNAEWERFTVAGIARVEQAKTHDDFVEALRTLFAPISPAIVIAGSENQLAGSTARRERFVERVRWWRHRGVRTTEQHADFESRVVTRWVPTATATVIGFLAIAFIAFTAIRVKRFRVAIGLLAVALALSLTGWIVWARSALDPAGVRRFALPAGVWLSIPATIPEDSAPPRVDPQADTRLERLAAVAIGWNVLQHFYPYELDDRRWLDALRTALRKASTDRTDREFLDTLRAMAASLGDSHAVVKHRSDSDDFVLPIRWDWMEGQLVVTEVMAGAATRIKPGDAATHLDGVPVEEAIARRETLVPASTAESKRWWAVRGLSRGEKSTAVELTVESFDGATFTERLTRGEYAGKPVPIISEPAPGIVMVDLSRISAADFERELPRMQRARGLIFQLRTYPFGFPEPSMIQHLVDRTIPYASFQTPIVTDPDRRGMRWETRVERLRPRAPILKKPIVWITSPAAISYAEHCLDAVQHHRLGAVLGQTTSGAFGGSNEITLPGRYVLTWTATRSDRLDGTPLHGRGIVPDAEARRTRRGVAEGRDEVLDQAIAMVRSRPPA